MDWEVLARVPPFLLLLFVKEGKQLFLALLFFFVNFARPTLTYWKCILTPTYPHQHIYYSASAF